MSKKNPATKNSLDAQPTTVDSRPLYSAARQIRLMARLVGMDESSGEYDDLDDEERGAIAETLRAAADAVEQAGENIIEYNDRKDREARAAATATAATVN